MSPSTNSTETLMGNNSYNTKHNLHQWLSQQRTKPPNMLHLSQNIIQPNNFPFQKQYKNKNKQPHQTSLQKASGNKYWGDDIETHDPITKRF